MPLRGDLVIVVHVADWRDVPTQFPPREKILDDIAEEAKRAIEKAADKADVVVRVHSERWEET
jgi:hypothetical protein